MHLQSSYESSSLKTTCITAFIWHNSLYNLWKFNFGCLMRPIATFWHRRSTVIQIKSWPNWGYLIEWTKLSSNSSLHHFHHAWKWCLCSMLKTTRAYQSITSNQDGLLLFKMWMLIKNYAAYFYYDIAISS